MSNEKVTLHHILADLPSTALAEEIVDVLARGAGAVKIERIVSYGHQTPPGEWYDQAQHEWVMVVQGKARLEFSDREPLAMQAGDHVLIPARCRHRVAWTTPHEPTVWLAVFYDAQDKPNNESNSVGIQV